MESIQAGRIFRELDVEVRAAGQSPTNKDRELDKKHAEETQIQFWLRHSQTELVIPNFFYIFNKFVSVETSTFLDNKTNTFKCV